MYTYTFMYVCVCICRFAVSALRLFLYVSCIRFTILASAVFPTNTFPVSKAALRCSSEPHKCKQTTQTNKQTN